MDRYATGHDYHGVPRSSSESQKPLTEDLGLEHMPPHDGASPSHENHLSVPSPNNPSVVSQAGPSRVQHPPDEFQPPPPRWPGYIATIKKWMTEEWFNFWIGVLAAINIAGWVALIYLVKRIDQLHSNPRIFWTSWMAILVGVSLVITLMSLLILAWIKKRHNSNPRNISILCGLTTLPTTSEVATKVLPGLATLVIEVLALLFTLLYFWKVAQNKYSKPKWEFNKGFNANLTAPGFALFGDYGDSASAILTQDWAQCNFPNWTSDGSTACDTMFPNKVHNLEHGPYGSAKSYVFNPSGNTTFGTNFSRPTDQLLLKIPVKWNSRAINESYHTLAPQNPTLYSIMYDSRLTFDDLVQALNCSILGWTEQPALGSSTYTIDETLSTVDKRGMLDSPNDSPDCADFKKKIYTTLEGGYKTYRYHLSSSGTSYSNICDMNGTDHITQSCISQVLIRYGSFGLSSMESKHGIGKTQMLLDVASIVGAVAYVAWFLTIFKN